MLRGEEKKMLSHQFCFHSAIPEVTHVADGKTYK